MSVNLFDFKKDDYSQYGEDGILEKLFSLVGMEPGYFVEFGAWDGKHWSNTYRLYENGWTGCLIEGEPERFQRLCRNIPDDGILKINAFVEAGGENSLDRLLGRHGIEAVDFLSIDIDSDDLAVWEGIREIEPKVVIIEYNPVIPFDTRYVNPPGEMHGNSALAIYESAQARGYVLVEGTDTNLIFARESLLTDSGIKQKTLQEIKDQTFQLRFFFAHNGTLLHNYEKLNETGITEIFPVPWSLTFGVQPVPRLLRKYRDRLSVPGLLFFVVFALIRCPVQLWKLAAFSVRTLTRGRSFGEALSLLFNKARLTNAFKNK